MAPKVSLGRLALIVPILILVAAIAYRTVNRYAEDVEMKTYKTFSSANLALDFTFKYPPVWEPRESKGAREPYDSVQVIGPRDEAREFSVSYSVTAKDTDKTAAQLQEKFLSSLDRFPNLKILKSKAETIGGFKTRSAVYEYIMRLPLWKTNAQNVLMMGRTCFLVKGNKSYRFSFLGTREQFEENENIFNHMLKSFKFSN